VVTVTVTGRVTRATGVTGYRRPEGRFVVSASYTRSWRKVGKVCVHFTTAASRAEACERTWHRGRTGGVQPVAQASAGGDGNCPSDLTGAGVSCRRGRSVGGQAANFAMMRDMVSGRGCAYPNGAGNAVMQVPVCLWICRASVRCSALLLCCSVALLLCCSVVLLLCSSVALCCSVADLSVITTLRCSTAAQKRARAQAKPRGWCAPVVRLSISG